MTDPLHEFLAETTKSFGEGSAIIIDENKKVDVEVIPTGVPVVDNALGVGGIPRGRITEIFGAEGCGKTSLCLHAMSQAQKMGQSVLFIDAEHALSIDRMRELGVDTSKMVLSQPDNGEQALNIAEMGIRSGTFSMVIIDSVAALVPLVEVEKDMGESVMGVHARLMSQAMRKLASPTSKFNVALVFTNQVRTKIGGYVAGEETTGGRALKFYASLRLRMQYVGQIKNAAGERISGKYRMTVVKNKVAVPFKIADFEINNYGLDDTAAFIDELEKAGVLTKSGNWYKLGDENLANGKPSLSKMLHEKADLKAQLVQALNTKTV
jgi:recombination protein RecA